MYNANFKIANQDNITNNRSKITPKNRRFYNTIYLILVYDIK